MCGTTFLPWNWPKNAYFLQPAGWGGCSLQRCSRQGTLRHHGEASVALLQHPLPWLAAISALDYMFMAAAMTGCCFCHYFCSVVKVHRTVRHLWSLLVKTANLATSRPRMIVYVIITCLCCIFASTGSIYGHGGHLAPHPAANRCRLVWLLVVNAVRLCAWHRLRTQMCLNDSL